jgi:hypothetical protein
MGIFALERLSVSAKTPNHMDADNKFGWRFIMDFIYKFYKMEQRRQLK